MTVVPPLTPETSVFINCPFDAEYQASFDGIIFATVCCGFTPRSALESETVAETRFDRLTKPLFASKYAIHDLSRCTGGGDENLARFNMPLELGMSIAKRTILGDEKHDWMVMVPEGHSYLSFISDLAAFDPVRHDGSLARIVMAVTRWLVTRPEGKASVTPKAVLEKFPEFQERKTELATEWLGDPPWFRVLEIAFDIARTLPVRQ